MLKNYIKIALRQIRTSRIQSIINIAGLAAGMWVAMLIGLWIADELSFNHYHRNYDRIVQVYQRKVLNSTIQTSEAVPLPLGEALRKDYANDFKTVVMASWTDHHIIQCRTTFRIPVCQRGIRAEIRRGRKDREAGRHLLIAGHFYFLYGIIRYGLFYGRTTHQGNRSA